MKTSLKFRQGIVQVVSLEREKISMTKSRRNFLKASALTSVAVALQPLKSFANSLGTGKVTKPIVISTWSHGVEANEVSFAVLDKNGSALDAVEKGVRVIESDPDNHSVGLGGAPDREGKVTLDACIMDHNNQCGAVAFLQDIENPISVARKVMEDTPHVFLAGKGAFEFAREKGFEKVNLLTPESKKNYEKWLENSKYQPIINIENHDTISSLALDAQGNLSGACTTSGMAYKLHGRVGDSPIIGAGLFVDNEVGAAAATGVGEEVIKIAGSSIIVELMRHGKSPQEACKEAVRRIIKNNKDISNKQVGFIALNKQGEYGAYSVHKGFNYAVKAKGVDELVDAEFEA